LVKNCFHENGLNILVLVPIFTGILFENKTKILSNSETFAFVMEINILRKKPAYFRFKEHHFIAEDFY
jgi:hypothetical protein